MLIVSAGYWERNVGISLIDRGEPDFLTLLEAGSLRRLCRPSDVAPLPKVRSLVYFQPVIEELQENPVPDGYIGYLRLKLRSLMDKADPAKVQKTTFSDDR